ncbi:acyltransferase [Streptococcus sp. zg-JUN1979]|uniref:acyltransferase n=1 Tax=Streptococcus sp. zg-JUN1979 TaxID=3391450 RepID=UPI0039A53D61
MISTIVKKITGKTISEDISVFYLCQRGLPYLLGRLRGIVRKWTFKGDKKALFLGKHTQVLLPKRLYLGHHVRLGNFVYIDASSRDGIHLGNHVKLGDYSKVIGSGSITHLGKGLEIGENSSFSEYTFFGSAGGIKIGSNVIAGQNVRFHAENHNFNDLDVLIREQGVTHKGIIVGDNCWIGAGATFLDGAKVGSGCVVAANAVITKEFPDNAIVGGIPAKIIGFR